MKIALMGCSGSGKSTFAKRLEADLGYPAIELDSYFHQPGWQQMPDSQFKEKVVELLANAEEGNGGWIVDGNYLSKLDSLVISKADVVLWFNLPKSLVMGRVIKRSLRRAITREELWNGNRESLSNLMRWDPEKSIIRWSWTQYGSYIEKLSALAAALDEGQLWLEIKSDEDLTSALNYLNSVNL